MSYTAVLVVSDNEAIVKEFINILKSQPNLSDGRSFRFACHPKHELLVNNEVSGYTIEPLDVKKDYESIIAKHDLVISAHCKQIFPPKLVTNLKCINIHPGYNPYNRGWYPQVFSILNGLPLGATIHEIDEELDHGKIIDREQVSITQSDTSLSAYERVQKAEIKLLKLNIVKILEGTYETFIPEEEGNVNFKRDFEVLREIKLEENVTFQQALDRLRALSHPPFKNAYFIDPETHERIWIEITLEKDQA